MNAPTTASPRRRLASARGAAPPRRAAADPAAVVRARAGARPPAAAALPADAATLLADRVVEIEVRDLGIRCRLRLGPSGFRAVPDGGPVTLRVAPTPRASCGSRAARTTPTGCSSSARS
jgi:hypothetical protein